jgi:hypothetical protein
MHHQNVLAMSGSASPIMTQSSFGRFSSQVASNSDSGVIKNGAVSQLFPVIVQGAGEHVFFMASDCMAAFVDPNSQIPNTVPNPSSCATQVPLSWTLPGDGLCYQSSSSEPSLYFASSFFSMIMEQFYMFLQRVLLLIVLSRFRAAHSLLAQRRFLPKLGVFAAVDLQQRWQQVP